MPIDETGYRREPFKSQLRYRKLPFDQLGPRYEALVFRMFDFDSRCGSIRPRWMSVRIHRACLRLRMVWHIGRSIWRDEWSDKLASIDELPPIPPELRCAFTETAVYGPPLRKWRG